MAEMVRVRYAPSPTRRLRLSGARTALCSALLASSHQGRLILRLDDTSQRPTSPELEGALYRDLAWLGVRWDEGPDSGGPLGPYRQSERDALYRDALRRLVARGDAYACYCSPAELVEQRRAARAAGGIARSGNRCRDAEQGEMLSHQGRSPVYRLRVPAGREIVWNDLAQGRVRVATDRINDFALYVARDENLEGGRALYDLAAAVDDHAMDITHVLCGEEQLANTARQILLHQALGHTPPRYGHLSRIVTPKGEATIARLASEGYLPEAVAACLVALGSPPGPAAEDLRLGALSERFDLTRLAGSPARFDPEQLRRVNRRCLRETDLSALCIAVRPRLTAAYGRWEACTGTAHTAEAWLSLLVGALREEAATLGEIVTQSAFALAEGRPPVSDTAAEVLREPQTGAVLRRALAALDAAALATPEAASERLRELRHQWRDEAGLRGRQVMLPIRAALVGSLSGPCLGIVTSLLGSARCRQRIEETLAELACS